jgi:hypothetical protein
MTFPNPTSSHQALVGVRWWHPDVDDRHIGPIERHEPVQMLGIGRFPNDPHPTRAEQPDQTGPHDQRVVGDDYPHGSTTLTPIFAGRCLSGLGIGADPCRDVARDSVGCVVGDSVVRLRDHGRRDREGVSLTGTGILGWP